MTDTIANATLSKSGEMAVWLFLGKQSHKLSIDRNHWKYAIRVEIQAIKVDIDHFGILNHCR